MQTLAVLTMGFLERLYNKLALITSFRLIPFQECFDYIHRRIYRTDEKSIVALEISPKNPI